MNNTAKQLANRLREVLLDGKWVTGTNLKEQIADLSWEEATTKVDSLNSIAALTFHIHYYIAGVLNVLEGGSLDIRDKYSFDMPPINSQKDWTALIEKTCSDSEKFIGLVEQLSEEKLAEAFVNPKYGNYHRNIDVLIEHSYYHLGQLILIKKLILRKVKG
ncbi:MAG: DinB family protein [Aureispira sp.]|nr:DinB family protein [Aureispira sp.]